MNKIEIGNKPLGEITPEEMLQIAIIEGACNSLKYWNVPVITDFSNTLFTDTVVLDYHAYRKKDNLKSADYALFFDFKQFGFFYTKDYDTNPDQPPNYRNVSIGTIKFLIEQGYDVPLYTDKRFCKGCFKDVTDSMFCVCGEFALHKSQTYNSEELPPD